MFGSNSEREGAAAAIALTVFMGSLLFLTLGMTTAVGRYDEGITLVGADLVLHGAVPNRDFYSLCGPGQFYILAGLFKIFGASVAVKRAWSILAYAAGGVMADQAYEPATTFGGYAVLRLKSS